MVYPHFASGFPFRLRVAAVALVLTSACDRQAAPAIYTGGSLARGGSQETGGSTQTGGLPGTGGATGGISVTGGRSSTGGNLGSGGSLTGGAINTGGTTGTGGSRSGGTASGGIQGSGGMRDAGVDTTTQPVDAISTGGRPSTGGAIAPDGSTGPLDTGGVTDDNCATGVYDSATPPKVLSLSGNLGVHDPVVLQAGNTYYLFATGLGAKTSTNLTTWAAGTRPFAAPAWMTSAVPGVTDLWAPDISYFGGKYHLYYSGSTFGSNKSCIGHATRDSMTTGTWTDQGSATICSNVGTTDNWNAIDPNVVLDTAGTPWLSLGSFWGGLKIIQLDAAGKRVGTTVTAIAARPNNGGAMEAPFIVRRCGFYYLFMSWDACCKGADSTYNIRVARATNVTGPYTDKAGTTAMQGGGTLIAQGDATFAGPGHQAVLFVGTKAYLVYHAYLKSNGVATLRIADLVWDANGWPMPVGP